MFVSRALQIVSLKFQIRDLRWTLIYCQFLHCLLHFGPTSKQIYISSSFLNIMTIFLRRLEDFWFLREHWVPSVCLPPHSLYLRFLGICSKIYQIKIKNVIRNTAKSKKSVVYIFNRCNWGTPHDMATNRNSQAAHDRRSLNSCVRQVAASQPLRELGTYPPNDLLFFVVLLQVLFPRFVSTIKRSGTSKNHSKTTFLICGK